MKYSFIKIILFNLIIILILFSSLEIILYFVGYPSTDVYNTRPDIFWGLTPNLKNEPFLHKEKGTYFNVSTNSLGLRGREISNNKKENEIRILCLGDSTTFGWGLEDDETYPSVLERLLNERFREYRFNVINGGIPGYTAFQGVNLIKEIGEYIDADIVIFGYIVQDARESPITDKEQAIRSRATSYLREHLLYRSRVYLGLKDIFTYLASFIRDRIGNKVVQYEKIRVPLDDYEDAILEFMRFCKRKGSILLLFGFPLEVPGYTIRHRVLMKILSDKFSIYYFDPSIEMKDLARENNLYFAEDRGHPNKEGAKMVAEMLLGYLERSGIIQRVIEER